MFDGLIDEVVVFSDILTTGEIGQIRQGTYTGVSTSTTTTTMTLPIPLANWHDFGWSTSYLAGNNSGVGDGNDAENHS